jgi:hypothetical protein
MTKVAVLLEELSGSGVTGRASVVTVLLIELSWSGVAGRAFAVAATLEVFCWLGTVAVSVKKHPEKRILAINRRQRATEAMVFYVGVP